MAACFMLAGLQGLSAQEKADSLSAPDSLMAMEEAPIRLNVDSIVKTKELKAPKDWSTWRPNPKRALWLALVIPAEDRSTTANTGNCHSSMADSWAVSMQ